MEKDEIHAFVTPNPEALRSGRRSGLVAVKDNICTKDFPTTCASRMLGDFVPAYDAAVITGIKRAGMTIAGKTNMDEFAMGSTTETSYFGATLHPFDPAYSPGGSSGGSAAAVAAGYVDMALGSDTGGSIRLPAAHCGIVGLKPTYGLVSRNGLIAYASSMDQIGPMGRTVADCAVLLDAIAGFDPADATSNRAIAGKENRYRASLHPALAGRRVGIPVDYLRRDISADVTRTLWETAERMRGLGAVVEKMCLGMAEYVAPVYYILACGEASSNLSRYDGIRYGYSRRSESLDDMYCTTRGEGFGKEVKRRILLGTYVLSAGYYDAYYRRAMSMRRIVTAVYRQALTRYDMLLLPAASQGPPKRGEFARNAAAFYDDDRCNVGANLAGLPAIAFPAGRTAEGMPVGMQLMGGPFREQTLLDAAAALEGEG